MGRVVFFHGITIFVNANDHRPPHCHVRGKGGVARYNIVDMKFMNLDGFSRSDAQKIEAQIKANIDEIWDMWRLLHGKE